MLGNVEKALYWKDFPCVPQPSYIEDLYLIMSAYHLYELIFTLLFNRKRRDFSEMFLHHVATLGLIAVSFNTANIIAGANIMLLHDFTDIFVTFIRCVQFSTNDKLIKTSWGLMFISWVYFRLYYFPTRIIIPYY